MGMLTNFGSMALDRIHNTLKVIAVRMLGYNDLDKNKIAA